MSDVLLGPSLLSTLFHPYHLLSLAVPAVALPPGQSTQGNPVASVSQPVSVPTPVSPAANFGMQATGEATLLAEAVADVVAREVVENPTWAEGFRASFGWIRPWNVVWSSEINVARHLLQAVAGKGRYSLQKLVECSREFAFSPL